MTWHTLIAIDFDKWAAETYRANFPGVRVECGPVSDFIDRLPNADVVLGGPPCQPHSHAGKRLASADERDGGDDYAAAVRKVMPRAFLMENVDGLLSSEGGRYFQRLYAMLEDAGYVLQYRVLDAVDFGVPQFRSRLWVWGIRRDLYVDGMRHCWPKPTHAWPPPEGCMFGAALLPGVTAGEALGLEGYELHRKRGKGMIERWGDRRDIPLTEPAPTINGGNGDGGSTGAIYLKPIAHAVTEYRWSDAMLYKHPPASPAPTVQAKWFKGGAEGLLEMDAPAHTISGESREPIQNWKGKGYCRRLLPLECARLQGVWDGFAWPEKITKTNQYRVIGNGWASTMGHVFAEAFAKADPESRTVIDLFCGGGLGACGWHGRYWASQLPAGGEIRRGK